MNKDEILELKIEDIGTDGEGIGHVDGYTLFVKDALPGDVVKAKVIKAKKSYGYGRLLEVIESSPDRCEAKCPAARACGGCQIQHMDYAAQLRMKQKRVKDCFTRIGGFEESFIDSVMHEIIGMEKPWHYRNKAQFPVGLNKEGKAVTGFYAGRTHSVIDTPHCFIQFEENDAIMEAVRGFIDKEHISVYNEETGKGLVRHVLTRKGFATDEIAVCIIINEDKVPKAEKLVESLLGACPKIKSITFNVNKEKTNVILGEKTEVLYGSEYIYDYIGDVKFRISPKSFFQVNPVQTKVLYGLALDLAKKDTDLKNLTVWDLYCGIGTISLFLAKEAGHVHGVEIVPAAIEDAKENAKLNGITNAEFYVGAAEDVAPSLPKPDVIVVDPPRKGCDEKLLATILKHNPPKVVYVSCDPATLARDVKILCEGGYTLEYIQPVDQFGHTVHVETCACLTKSGH
jgi:23S rRNA (uracil1939-C5)-methyltransferase